MIRCPQMSSIKYHKPSHKILLTSREPDHSCGLYFFSPPLSAPDDDRPHWLLGESAFSLSPPDSLLLVTPPPVPIGAPQQHRRKD